MIAPESAKSDRPYVYISEKYFPEAKMFRYRVGVDGITFDEFWTKKDDKLSLLDILSVRDGYAESLVGWTGDDRKRILTSVVQEATLY